MALSAGSSAVWSDIKAIYDTLRTIQSTHGLSQTGYSGGQGASIARTNIVTLYNAANSAHGETHLRGKSWTNVTIPAAGTVIQPGFINTIRTNVNNMSGVCHNDSFNSFTRNSFHDWFDGCFCQFNSKRELKENIHRFTKSALDIINNTEIVDFNYKTDEDKNYKVGFIADDTDEILSTKNHDQMDVYNSIGIMMKAIQELSEKIDELKDN